MWGAVSRWSSKVHYVHASSVKSSGMGVQKVDSANTEHVLEILTISTYVKSAKR